MIYHMPLDECPHCGARTPRIFKHRCPEQKENGRVHATAASEIQSWIAAQVAARPARVEPSTRPPVDRLALIRLSADSQWWGRASHR
jgi:hypothetical protein